MSNHTAAPVSPHLQIWRWTATMFASIVQRVTGVGMYFGSVLIAAWIGSAALGPSAFAMVQGIFASPIGLIILIGYSWAICFHLLNGLRFLFWDAGYGFAKETATKTAWGAITGSIVLTALIWAAVMLTSGGN